MQPLCVQLQDKESAKGHDLWEMCSYKLTAKVCVLCTVNFITSIVHSIILYEQIFLIMRTLYVQLHMHLEFFF